VQKEDVLGITPQVFTPEFKPALDFDALSQVKPHPTGQSQVVFGLKPLSHAKDGFQGTYPVEFPQVQFISLQWPVQGKPVPKPMYGEGREDALLGPPAVPEP
jgi:hypothetical protein